MPPKKNNTMRRRSSNTMTQLYVNQKEQQDRINDSVSLINSLKKKNKEIYSEKRKICKKYPISSSVFFCNSTASSLLRSKLNDTIDHNNIVISRERKKLKRLTKSQRQKKHYLNTIGGNKTRRNRRKLI